MRKYDRARFYTKHLLNGVPRFDFNSTAWVKYRKDIKKLSTEVYVVTKANENRIWKISDQFYGSFDYWWLLCLVNDILDPTSEIPAGKHMVIPRLSDLEVFYQKIVLKSKGVLVARQQ